MVEIGSLAVTPGVTVQMTIAPSDDTGTIIVDAVNYDQTLRYPDQMDAHPLLRAAIAEIPPPSGCHVHIQVAAQLPLAAPPVPVLP
jgi:hypothetical protein